MLMQIQSASAEESSILKGADVTEQFLKWTENQWVGTDLIGDCFKDFIAHISHWDPWRDGSAEFGIWLPKPTRVRTVFILNYCYDGEPFWDNRDFGRDLIGPGVIKVGSNFRSATISNEVVAENINDGGF